MNYMDDVGQTLLNWASAFGTLEMVGYSSFSLLSTEGLKWIESLELH